MRKYTYIWSLMAAIPLAYYIGPIVSSTNDYSHIGGSWILSAKNINFYNNTLCADLKTGNSQPYFKYIGDDSYMMVEYNSSCIKINENVTALQNIYGKFKSYTTNITYHQAIIYPKGSWIDSAKNPTYFPNSVCASFLQSCIFDYFSNTNRCAYIEDCIEFTQNDYLVNVGGKFKKLTYPQYIRHDYCS